MSRRECKGDALRKGKELGFDSLQLDDGIRDIVITLMTNGVETFESCEGGRGHSYPCPIVRFEGEPAEGLRALSVAISHGLPVSHLRRVWDVFDGYIEGPCWEMTFSPPNSSPIWSDRDTSERYLAMKSAAKLNG
jgi:hypothetical protein